MAIEIKAPAFPESVADGEVATWHKQEGDAVSRDELLVEIETDKVVMEVVAPEDGVLVSIDAPEGTTIDSGALLGTLKAGAASKKPDTDSGSDSSGAGKPQQAAAASESAGEPASASQAMGPAARQLVDEHQLDPKKIAGSGKGGRITKEDVVAHMRDAETSAASAAPAKAASVPAEMDLPSGHSAERVEKRVPMTRMRARIAERLLEASQQTAMLTTFNEVNMAPVMALRNRYKEQFEKTHNGTRLGFMGFFVKAACEALKRFPEVNASIDGNDVVYHGYQDIGVAVSTPGGLVVPVLRDADFMSLADIEAAVSDLGKRARDNKLSIDDMTGGTFTVTNGGVFGSLLSTPILNPPQTGILGMHKIQERPMAVDGQVVIQPMMYLALSYDHRLIDGKTAVQFLVAVKDLIEDPARILLQL
ncbi:2-oxoglutarate dehydrogenase complex dihydrolipoyllysine-residue succinyltransferase [Chromatocurvus halotolerans]|uniref:Dihydrolipoyllysine-residue succinyltransferase component of 2-oxoglutarate dehydrogenase complex n=1 Tax=Chromatocurvus halotolerans TaxID=1132028 RepID=A0A4R2L5B0_9GAMM|nr:2-oxoglutarate dehydrogenase complex dihydrolipoyllysine-residue succinyltransferase [Chromatocurvus halotolerans]TCO77818.1 2-oxoglutarate dehydrogenase E2 component [Chromatocurvus halotolerans]